MSRKIRKTHIGVGLAVLALAAAAALVLTSRPAKAPEEAPPAGESALETEGKPVNVTVQVLEPETAKETFTLPGTLEARENLILSLEQAGTIEWIGPEEGDRVSRGQEILRMDTKLLEVQLSQNRTNYELKKKQFERTETLLEKQLISEKEYDEARNAYETALAMLSQTEIALQKSILVSPIDGILDSLLVDRGEYGNPGTPAAKVVQVDRLKVLVDIPEKDVTSLKVGQEVTVLAAGVEGGSGPIKKGKVISVGYEADEMTRTYPAKIEIDNRSGLLRPGMIVRVRFVRKVLDGVLVVPLYAVLDRNGEKMMFVEENGYAVRRQVRLGPVIDGRVVVFGGLQPGESLIVKGQQLLADGGPVRVLEEN